MENGQTQSALRWAAPFVTGGLVVLVWLYAVNVAKVPGTVLPKPDATLQSLWKWYSTGAIWPHFRATVGVALAGYAVGAGIAVVLAALMALYAPVNRHLAALITTVQAIPKVALAPLLYIWLGFGPQTGITLVALSCFYPVVVNALEGFRSANPELVDLYRSYRASHLRRFFAINVPSALPQIFVGLEIAIVFALIGAVVMEFIAAPRGLGFMIQDAANTLDTATVFAALVTLAAVGITLSALVRLLRRKIVFWDRSNQQETLNRGGM